jgi:transposase
VVQKYLRSGIKEIAMNEFNAFIGIDISKKTFDACLVTKADPRSSSHHVFSQCKEGFKEFSHWLKEQDVPCAETLFCMEHTGLYSEGLIQYLVQQKICLWVEMAIKIKRSMGLQRGGDDKASSIIIANYAMRFTDQARLWNPMDTRLSEIRMLMKQRERLITALKQLMVPVHELESTGNQKMARQLQANQRLIIRQMEKSIAKIDEQINELIKADASICRKVECVTSIKGVGQQTAIALLVYTKGFSMFENSKQLACYCGVVPFTKSSGTSVRYKPGVSPFANRRLKSLLHLCAMAALRHDAEIRAYYQRKVSEGKNKMSVVNAIRNKLLQRIFAVLRDDRDYVEHYNYQPAKMN